MIVDLYEEQHIHNSIKLYRLANDQKIHLSYIINDFPKKTAGSFHLQLLGTTSFI